MRPYADTGFLCSLYAPDAHTQRAVAAMTRQKQALPFAWLHQLEFRNALRLRVFRGEISKVQRDASLNTMLSDMASGLYSAVTVEQHEVMIESERLSAGFSEKLGTRSLDILHVALALVLGRDEFLTFDQRQGALAKSAGLKVPSL